jgi:hypothetical protein
MTPVSTLAAKNAIVKTRRWANGLYLYTILQDGEKVSSGKFIISH